MTTSFFFFFSYSFLGQVGGLASASAVFQSRLDAELHERLPPGSEEVCFNNYFKLRNFQGLTFFFPLKLIKRIRHSARLVDSLPTDLQRLARDSYASSLKSVFILAACASLLAYICRLPVSSLCWLIHVDFIYLFNLVQIPDKRLSDHLDSNDGDDDDSDTLSDVSSTIEEIRDDEDKIVRPNQRHRSRV